jgi:hypothetical protein
VRDYHCVVYVYTRPTDAADRFFARHKRLLGAALRSRSDAAREREWYLRALTHNLMVLAAVP